MKITSNFNTTENDTVDHYPRLMVKSVIKRYGAPGNLIVMFDTPTSGMILHDTLYEYEIGTYRTDWFEYLFVPFYGDITIFSSGD